MPEKIRTDRFLSDILRNQITQSIHYDTKANWTLGVSGVLMGLTLPRANSSLPMLVIFASASLSFLISLLVFLPPRRFKSDRRKNGLMYYRGFSDMTLNNYIKALSKLKTQKQMTEQYAIDIYNMAHSSVIVKKKFLTWPNRILFFGTLLGLLLML
ncbi:hypothetical protein CMO91_06045 [Candidatus Woesearchaeota archaeon]|nr:hypothetical protein [Candidatus Woesearchaeota archaeon]|tara:strand:+ start:703 stop:1170 length:468 start_codon:yes stop_codon:yes gene_type:complete